MHKLRFITGQTTVTLDLLSSEVDVNQDSIESTITIDLNLSGERAGLAEPYALLLIQLCEAVIPPVDLAHRRAAAGQLVRASTDALFREIMARWEEEHNEG